MQIIPFLGSLVAEETSTGLYNSSSDEYTIAGGFPNMNLRFSFKEGQIALAYLRTVIDPETQYPVIPDDIKFITAITYYIKWPRWHLYRRVSIIKMSKWNKYNISYKYQDPQGRSINMEQIYLFDSN